MIDDKIKFLKATGFEKRPSGLGYTSPAESVVWGKRFLLIYLSVKTRADLRSQLRKEKHVPLECCTVC
jgi:hypothetical protein